MKATALTLAAAAAALTLSSCDQAKDAANEAAAKAKAAAAEVKTEAEAAAPGLKEKAANALDAAKTAGAGALDEAKAKAADLADWTKAKLGVPEADGVLDGFRGLFDEAKAAVASGMTGEKATALKAKWDALQTSTAAQIDKLAPEHKEKLQHLLTVIKAKWDQMLEQSKDGKVS